MNNTSLILPSPAKLNLMLHITGRRADGYHNLQTLFQFIDFCDQLTFKTAAPGKLRLAKSVCDVADEDNLIIRAARLLLQHTGTAHGAKISIDKNIPMGAGLGGGSSNAATTLVALNRLWNTELSLNELARLGLKLGADVPVFIHGCAAWAEGLGEKLTAVELAEPWFLIITPDCHVSTGEIFCHRELTRNTSPITIATALEHGGKNDCQTVVEALYPAVKTALEWLAQFAKAKLTGTGSSLFASFKTRAEAEEVYNRLPKPMTGFIARGLNLSPLHQAAKINTLL